MSTKQTLRNTAPGGYDLYVDGEYVGWAVRKDANPSYSRWVGYAKDNNGVPCVKGEETRAEVVSRLRHRVGL